MLRNLSQTFTKTWKQTVLTPSSLTEDGKVLLKQPALPPMNLISVFTLHKFFQSKRDVLDFYSVKTGHMTTPNIMKLALEHVHLQ